MITFFQSQHCNSQGEPQDEKGANTPTDFNPTVTATCGAGRMTIAVATNAPFYGKIMQVSSCTHLNSVNYVLLVEVFRKGVRILS